MRTAVICCGWLLGCLLLGGCGGAEYEARLQRSKELYEYLQLLDQSLAMPAWNRADIGTALRVPLPFRQTMAAPVPEQDEDGNPLPIVDDPRQPHVLGVDLPGLVEAWQGELPGAPGELAEARLYICSNHQRYLNLGPNTPAPEEFLRDLEIALQAGFGVMVPEGESQTPADNVRYRHISPARSSNHSQYTTPRDFTAIRFVPSEPLGGQDVEGMYFGHQAGKVQVGIICLLPRNTGAQFRDRLNLALGTLIVSPEAPRPRKSQPGVPGGGGGGVSNPGF
ncbi:MAG: hypothetical protein KDA58_01350 [Planctomycetaceae bacterium]|nr:hypothetical protein [Planctomycetaceae bacterium]